MLLLRSFEAPLVYTANHTYRMAHQPGSARRLMSPLEARAYRRAAMVLAISPSTAAGVRDLGVRADRVEVLAPGVDVPADPPTTREGFHLLFAGRWEPEKGVLDAVAVMREVIARRAAATGMVVGDGSLAARVRAAAAGTPGLTVAGRVDDDRLARQYHSAAVVLMPSRYEGLGLVALEAQARGAVVVGYDVEGLRDAVAEPSLLVDRGDAGAADRALHRACATRRRVVTSWPAPATPGCAAARGRASASGSRRCTTPCAPAEPGDAPPAAGREGGDLRVD